MYSYLVLPCILLKVLAIQLLIIIMTGIVNLSHDIKSEKQYERFVTVILQGGVVNHNKSAVFHFLTGSKFPHFLHKVFKPGMHQLLAGKRRDFITAFCP